MSRSRHDRVMELFLRACDLEGAEREGYLCEAAGPDTELRREIEQLLSLDSEGTLTPIPQLSVDREEAVTEPKHHSAAERYEIGEEIARGGTATVHQAWDRNLDREVALKRLFKSKVNNPGWSRMIREAVVTGGLEHPGVPAVHEIGKSEDGELYIAYRLVRGKTLSALLKERKAPGAEVARFLDIFERVCQTLAYAHARGIVHRDLKPANVMVDEFGDVQVMDWGLAAMEQAESDGAGTSRNYADSNERAGSALGTLGYMAPEQSIGRWDKRSDVFGLGAILCEILTGDPPFIADSPAEALMQAVKGNLEEAGEKLRTCGADPALTDLATRCIQAEPGDRPADAAAVAAAAAAYRQSVEDRLREAERAAKEAEAERNRRRLSMVAGAVITALLLALLGVGAMMQSRSAARRAALVTRVDEAISSVTSLRELALDGEKLNTSVWVQTLETGKQLATLSEEENLPPTLQAKARQLGEELAEAEICRRLIENLEETRLTRLPRRLHNWADPRHGIPGIESSFERHGFTSDATEPAAFADWMDRQPRPLRQGVISWLNQWFTLLSRENRADSWPALVLEQADRDSWRRQWRKAVLEEDRELIHSLMANEDTWRRDPPDLVDLALSAVRLERKFAAPAGFLRRAEALYPDDFWLNFWCAWFLAHSPEQMHEGYFGHLREADAMIFSRSALAQRPTASVWYLHGEICRKLRLNEDAHSAFERTLELDPLWAGVDLPSRGEPDQGIAAMKAAVALEPKNANYLDGLGSLYLYAGRLQEAEESLLQAIEHSSKPEHARQFHLASVYRRQGRKDDAIPLLEEAIAARPKFHDYWKELAWCHIDGRQWPEAEEAARKAVELNPAIADSQRLLGRALVKQDEFQEAVDHYAKVYEVYRDWGQMTPDWHLFQGVQAAAKAAAQLADAGKENESGRFFALARKWMEELLDRYPAEVSEKNDQPAIPPAELLKVMRNAGEFEKVKREKSLQLLTEDEAAAWRRIWKEVERLWEASGGRGERDV